MCQRRHNCAVKTYVFLYTKILISKLVDFLMATQKTEEKLSQKRYYNLTKIPMLLITAKTHCFSQLKHIKYFLRIVTDYF
jgi:hypothetical protein